MRLALDLAHPGLVRVEGQHLADRQEQVSRHRRRTRRRASRSVRRYCACASWPAVTCRPYATFSAHHRARRRRRPRSTASPIVVARCQPRRARKTSSAPRTSGSASSSREPERGHPGPAARGLEHCVLEGQAQRAAPRRAHAPQVAVERGRGRPVRAGQRRRGSRGSGPAIAASSRATSAARRPIGPSTDRSNQAWPLGRLGTRPGVGRRPNDVAEAGRVAQRAAHVAAVGDGHHARGQRDGGSPAAAAAGCAGVVGVAGDPKTGLCVCEPAPNSGTLVLPTRTPPASWTRAASRASVVGTSRRTGRAERGAQPGRGQQVLVGDRQPVQGADGPAPHDGLVELGGPGRGPLVVPGDDGVERGIDLVDAAQRGLEQLTGRQLARTQEAGQLDGGQQAQVVDHGRSVGAARPCQRCRDLGPGRGRVVVTPGPAGQLHAHGQPARAARPSTPSSGRPGRSGPVW